MTPPPSVAAQYFLQAVSYIIHLILTYFAADRFIWDQDIRHYADVDTWQFYGLPLLVAYAISFVLFTVVFIGRCVYWCKCKKGDPPAWLEDRGIWSAALSIVLSLLSLITLIYDRVWHFEGGYPPEYITTMIALNLGVLVDNLVLFFHYVPRRPSKSSPPTDKLDKLMS